MAERIGREARLRLYSPRVVAMDSYDVTSLPAEPLVVFVTATTGQVSPVRSTSPGLSVGHALLAGVPDGVPDGPLFYRRHAAAPCLQRIRTSLPRLLPWARPLGPCHRP